MRFVRSALVLAAVLAVAAAYVTGRHDGSAAGEPNALAGRDSPAAGAIRITFAYSSNLEEMMATLLPRFNAERVAVAGRPLHVDGVSASSGDVYADIVGGRPASSLWGRLLNNGLDRDVVADRNPYLASSPVVIAMREPLARALGWPREPIGFGDVVKLASSGSSWVAYRKPTFGRFKLGHTNPDFPTPGLAFVAAHYYTAAGKREGLTVTDVSWPAIRAHVRALQRSIVQYGDTGSFFARAAARARRRVRVRGRHGGDDARRVQPAAPPRRDAPGRDLPGRGGRS